MGTVGAGDLFRILRDGSPRTRGELVDETGLARTTVVVRLAALQEIGLVSSLGNAASSGGRPASRVAFDASARTVVAVDLGATHGVVGITDLRGEVRITERRELDIAAGPQATLDWVIEAAQRLLADLDVDPSTVLGVGIGVPGPVQHSTGRPIRPPIMPGWDGFDIPALVRERIDVPTFVDNDVNVLAIGERATSWPDVDDLLFIKVSTGIGAGVISGGSLQRGAQGSAGDIGHVQVPHYSLDERDLEAIASAPAIAQELSAASGERVPPGAVAERIRIGDPVAIAAARDAGRAIGEVAAMCVSLLNPSTVVVGGRLGVLVQEIIAGVREVVYKRSIPLSTQYLNIVPARGGIDAGVRGAALMVIDELLSPEAIDRMVADLVGRSSSGQRESSNSR